MLDRRAHTLLVLFFLAVGFGAAGRQATDAWVSGGAAELTSVCALRYVRRAFASFNGAL